MTGNEERAGVRTDRLAHRPGTRANSFRDQPVVCYSPAGNSVKDRVDFSLEIRDCFQSKLYLTGGLVSIVESSHFLNIAMVGFSTRAGSRLL